MDSSISQAAQKMCFSPTPPSLSKASAGMARSPPASSIAFTASRITALHRSTCAGARARAPAISCAKVRRTSGAKYLRLPGKPPPLVQIRYQSGSKGIAAVGYQATSERLECFIFPKNPEVNRADPSRAASLRRLALWAPQRACVPARPSAARSEAVQQQAARFGGAGLRACWVASSRAALGRTRSREAPRHPSARYASMAPASRLQATTLRQ